MSDAAPQPMSIARRLSDLAAAHPDRTAIVFAPADGAEVEITWAGLERAACRTARLLERHGVGLTSLVAVGLPGSIEHFVVSIGAWKLGACVLPLRWDLPRWERNRLLGVAAPAVVVADWDDVAFPRLSSAQLAEADTLSADPLPDRVAQPAHAIATSGATGHPKLVVTPGPGLYTPSPAGGGRRYEQARAGQVQLIAAPLYHTTGFRVAHNALLDDQTLVVMERFAAERAVDLIERRHVNLMTMVPTMLARIARLPEIARRDLSSLDRVLQGAAACPPWVVRAWIDLVGPDRFFIAYGASETIGLTLARGDEWLTHPGTVGRGVGTSIRIVDEAGAELPAGEVGEIFLKNTSATGPTYEYRGAAPAPTTADGYVSVGDLGWVDDDGYLYIADRRADMIVSGGANVYPAEVEAALSEHPRVADVAVIGLPDPEWGRRVCAIVQPADPKAPPSADELDRHCRARLTAYKAPKSYEFVDRLPRSEAGKINRALLARERVGNHPDELDAPGETAAVGGRGGTSP
jgi:bile acid-coenzyme A ligase